MFIDVISAIAISFGFYLGYKRGLIKTVFDTLSLLVGILAALKLSPWTMDVLQSIFNLNKAVTLILGIAITFLIVMMAIRYVGKKMEDILEVAHINVLNKIAGGGLQALFFGIIFSYCVSFLDKIHVLKEETKTSSLSYPALMQMPALSQKLFDTLKPVFSEFWSKTNEAIDGLKKEEQQ
jgi:membrane protein required for colicin V production